MMHRHRVLLAALCAGLLSGACASITDRFESVARPTAPTQAAGIDDVEGFPAAGDPPTDCTALLGRGTDRSVAVSISCEHTGSARVFVEDTVTGEVTVTAPTVLDAGVAVSVDLTGLSPNRAYRYAIEVDGVAGPHHTFHTQRATGEPFVFTVDADPHFGDPRFNADLYRRTLTNASADSPDFHVDLGDLFMTEKSRPASLEAAAPTFTGLRPYLQTVAADASLHLVNGNHEGELGWLLTAGSDRQLPLWSTTLRATTYAVPSAGDFFSGATDVDPLLGTPRDSWYSFVWGDARIIVLDPFWYTRTKPKNTDPDGNWAWTLGADQYQWLVRTLQANQSRYTFVMIHHLVGGGPDARGGTEVSDRFEWGGRSASGMFDFATRRPGWEAPIHDLLVRYGVSAVFRGHDHVYVAQERDGIRYQLLPQPSNTAEDSAKLAVEYGYGPGTVISGSGHLRVSVTSERATVEFVRSVLPSAERADRRNGAVADRYELLPTSRS